MLFTFLLVVHAIIAAALVGVILMQRSEGGGLGMGGSPSGLMSARGAADFLTRATTVLATLFVAMCIGLATLASFNRSGSDIDPSLARTPAPQQTPLTPGTAPIGNASAPIAPPSTDPLAAPAGAPPPVARIERVETRPAPRAERAPERPAPDPVAPTPTPPPAISSTTTPPANPAAGGNDAAPEN